MIEERLEHRGHAVGDGDRMAAEDGEGGAGFEPRDEMQRGAPDVGAEDRDDAAEAVEERNLAEHAVLAAQAQDLGAGSCVADDVVRAEEHALGEARRPRGVLHVDRRA